MPAYAQRISRVQEVLRDLGIGAAVFGPTDQMRYLSGWREPGHERLIALIVPALSDPAFLVPEMNAAQARANPAGIADVRGWSDEAGWTRAMAELFAQKAVAGTIAVDDELQAGHLLAIQGIASGSRFVPTGDLMATLREIKDSDELESLARSAAITDQVYAESLSALRRGITERQFQSVIAERYRAHGTEPAFALVCFGANSALPHHHTGETSLQPGNVVVIDIGCHWEGYASDITRTLAFGEPGAGARQVYEIVHAAHMAARQAARPGAACEQVDSAARQVITRAGYGDRFIHRTGHGIGLSTHEPPYIVGGNSHTLRPGMCFSIEPGIYIPERFGVRIENIVTVTEDGAHSLNADAPETLPVLEDVR